MVICATSLALSQPAGSSLTSSYDSVAKKIIVTALTSNKAVETLTELTTKIGNRLSGSSQATKAVLVRYAIFACDGASEFDFLKSLLFILKVSAENNN